MSVANHLRALKAEGTTRVKQWLLAHRIRALHPTLASHPSTIWDYAYGDTGCIRIGADVTVQANAEILVYRRTRNSSVEGGLTLGDRSVVSTGVNIRAAGGQITIGDDSGVAQGCVLVAANHQLQPGWKRFRTPWDEDRCGVELGNNVWVGALSVLLPGTKIGDNAVIAAGSVVRGNVPAGELWGGIPARKLKDIESVSPPVD